MSVHLSGGGWSETGAAPEFSSFIKEASARAEGTPKIAVVFWIPADGDLALSSSRYETLMRRMGEFESTLIPLIGDATLDGAQLEGFHGIFVGGGLTPGYHRAIMPAADAIRSLVSSGVPYCGYSAGAMIAGEVALLGGFTIGGVAVTADSNGEDLEEVSVEAGLGLIDLTVDAHAAQWGTLSRTVAAVDAGIVERGVAVDEHTVLIVRPGALHVVGAGNVWSVARGAEGGVNVGILAADN
ncbi:Type 1 glutamine amidotransferase-like domain-containing protein [Humidisolicoccus flavus]|uniref:Type 1 glutamine amidotransferase-like domain-containing protein n=1 Tax=Humidisolicoccus flavus TaxID=3111414 RepID=UPI003251C901